MDADARAAQTGRFRAGMQLLEQAGFERLAYEDFAEAAMELLDQLPRLRLRAADGGEGGGEETLQGQFNRDEVSNAVVVYLRLLASAWIGAHRADFAPFLDLEVDEFRAHRVEAFGQEADDAMLTALVGVLGVNLDVIYLDRSEGEEGTRHEFRSAASSGAPITLLCKKPSCLHANEDRPGHYDILA